MSSPSNDLQLYALSSGTRFYCPSSGAAAVSPAFDAAWEDTSAATRLRCVTTKSSTAMTTVSFTDLDTTDRDILVRQYVSDAIDAQTIPATIARLQFRARELSSTEDMFIAWGMRVVSNDGTVVRGTLVTVNRGPVEFATSLTNAGDSANTTAVTASANDRIVIELGAGGDPTAVHDFDLRIGDTGSTDLIEDNANTTDNVPWVELSYAITFAGAATTWGGLLGTQRNRLVVVP